MPVLENHVAYLLRQLREMAGEQTVALLALNDRAHDLDGLFPDIAALVCGGWLFYYSAYLHDVLNRPWQALSDQAKPRTASPKL